MRLYAYTNGNPVSNIDPLGLASCGFFDCPSLPQSVVNASAGIGDALLFDQGARLRRLLNINGGVDTCSSSYKGGQIAGIIGSFADGEGEVQLSERVLARMIEEPGAYHNFPFSIALEALEGEGQVISSNYTLYTLEGAINGVNGAYEIGVNAANQITHYFFRPF